MRRVVLALCLVGAVAPWAAAKPAVGGDQRSDRAATRGKRASDPEPTANGTKPSASAPSHVFSKAFATWVYPEPRIEHKARLGYVRLGQSVKLRSTEPVAGPGCSQGFYAVEPHGYVCHDRTVSLTGDTRYLKGKRLTAPTSDPLPFDYALSNGTPMYRRLPTPEEWKREERFLGEPGSHKPLSWGNRGHEKLAESRAIEARDPTPFFLENGGSIARPNEGRLVRRSIPLGSMLAYTKSFEHAGRTWLLSADGTVVPADRVRPFRESRFHGVRLGAPVGLPIAWIKKTARPKYRQGEAGFVDTGAEWAVRTVTALDPDIEPVEVEQRRFLPTRERDAEGRRLWIAESDATPIFPREKRPWGVGESDKWIIVSITGGTLVAYEGDKPVFSTLVSPGVGGVPMRGRDPVEMSTTPMGIFRVTFKHRAATMSPEQGENRSFWIADVPNTQYFDAPFALHTAFWHESFGEPMSAGCINLSPKDGQYLFDWSDPKVPADWNGAAARGLNGKGTFVVVVR